MLNSLGGKAFSKCLETKAILVFVERIEALLFKNNALQVCLGRVLNQLSHAGIDWTHEVFAPARTQHSVDDPLKLLLSLLAIGLLGPRVGPEPGQPALADDAQVKNDAGTYRGFSLAHNARSEAEVDALFKEALALGASALKTPQKVFWGGYSGYVADPDHNYWEIAFNPFMPSDDL